MEVRALDQTLTDGVVSLRAPQPGDATLIIAGRDQEFRRFIGQGSAHPAPTAVIVDSSQRVVGWIDYDVDRAWLAPGEVNVGYSTFGSHRGRGYATRAVVLLTEWLTSTAEVTTATLLIDPANEPSIGVAKRAGFRQAASVDDQLLFELELRTPQGGPQFA